ncbi:MAG: hypothetical protein HY057_04720, partial [Rhodospirillales bacterium]|nr:hypothetical protein [Rhodospirillales bacterium]
MLRCLRPYYVLPFLLSPILPNFAAAQTPALAMEEFMVPTRDAGIEIYVRNKRPADLTQFRAERTVLFVHGATYPAHAAFDLQ